MNRLPSVKTLLLITQGNLAQAKQVRAVLETSRSASRTLSAVSDIVGSFGVEYIPAGTNAKSHAIAYVNTGDMYYATLIYCNGRFIVASVGDIVERGNYD